MSNIPPYHLFDFEVFVYCATYNHSAYVKDALYGFSIQQTSFSYAAFILDDCSTDGNQKVIRSWVEENCDRSKIIKIEADDASIIIASPQNNDRCHFVCYLLNQNIYKQPEKRLSILKSWIDSSKYISLCEGDDFWTSPVKLEKQYRALEEHTDCAICFSRVRAVGADGMTSHFIIPPMKTDIHTGRVTTKDLARIEFKDGNWCFHTSSFFFRSSVYWDYVNFKQTVLPSFPYGDMPLQLFYLQFGGYFIDEEFGCYRWLSGGWNSSARSNLDNRKSIEKRVIEGYKEFDKFSSYQYHSEIQNLVLRKEFYILHEGICFKWKYRYLVLKNVYKIPYKYIKIAAKQYLPGLHSFVKNKVLRLK